MVDASPFAATLAAIAPRQSCRITEHEGRTVVDDEFGGGHTLHVERQATSEFTLLEARFAQPQPLDARELLQRAERAAFGAEGCDVDWETPESDMTNADGQRETVYRGETCNCQARGRSTSAGGVVGLVFRSAC